MFDLLDKAQGDPRLAERGIIYIDEIDKIRTVDTPGHRDVSGRGVQNALLTLVEGRDVVLRYNDKIHQIDSSRILFVCSGAFVGLDEIVRKRLTSGKDNGIGFGQATTCNLSKSDLLSQVHFRDLVEYGLIPELIGRFPVKASFKELTENDLLRILTETNDSALGRQKEFFAVHGVELLFTEDALRAVAAKALAIGTGARSLSQTFNDVLEDTRSRLDELVGKGASTIRFTKEVVQGSAAPVIKYRRDPRTSTRAEELRHRIRLPGRVEQVTVGNGSQAQSPEDMRAAIVALKSVLGWEAADARARARWQELEQRLHEHPQILLDICQGLVKRRATLQDLSHAMEQSGTDDIPAFLYYLDYVLRLRAVRQPAQAS